MDNGTKSEFSIAIRTLGKAGRKYEKLLRSIRRSRVQPQKILIVIPEGYEKPKTQLGNEEFIFSSKSMILQRIEALKYINTEYTLFLDDDIEFDNRFIEKLLEPLEKGIYDCSTGPLFSFFPASKPGIIAGTLTASVSVSLLHRHQYVHILRSGGWSYHRFNTKRHHFLPTESFAWTCFMIRTDVMKRIHMEDEYIWLERFGYAAGDDRVMSYKLVKKGYKACIVTDAVYKHNDARTSTSKEEIQKKGKTKFCMYYMHTVFWHRFVQEFERKKLLRIQNVLWFNYWKITMFLYLSLKSLVNRDRVFIESFIKGVREGERYIRTTSYKQLPKV